MFTKLDQLIPRIVNKYDLNVPIKAAQVVTLWPQVLKEVFDNGPSEQSEALHLKNGILTVKVTSCIIAQEIQLHKLEILKKLNAHYGEERVRDIRFKTQK